MPDYPLIAIRPVWRTRWLGAFVAALAVVIACQVAQCPVIHAAPPPSIGSDRPEATPSEIDALIAENRLSDASERLRGVDESNSRADWTRTLATLASRYQQQANLAATAEYFARAVLASQSPTAASIPNDKKCLLRLAASAAMLKSGRADAAYGTIKWNLENDPDHARVAAAAKLLLQIGSHALSTGDPLTAASAYQAALPKLSGGDAAAAELGHAWAIALHRERPEEAAELLARFAEKYPDHSDAPRAVRACASCLQQAERHADADKKLAELLTKWPQSQSAVDVVASHIAAFQAAPSTSDSTTDSPSTIPAFVSLWIVDRVKSGATKDLTDRMYSVVLASPAVEADPSLWQKIANALALADTTGQVTSETLERLSASTLNSDAEHFAAMLISPKEPGSVTSAAREAACRWAGRTQRWSMLALAAEHESPTDSDPTRTIGVERLFAEGLMQVGRPADARIWWEHVVDVRKAEDFPTLLRCAETAVAHATVQEAAARIDVAQEASAEDPFRETLLKMLSADLAIRQLSFDRARSLLENVVRSPGEIGSLRPRAQWLIGETFYMQQRFAEAVEAYRTVEGLDPQSTWIAASLVQAGKAFEQLGRTRDAAVCYSTLLSRHADSPLAQDARRRLAELAPPGESTIRR